MYCILSAECQSDDGFPVFSGKFLLKIPNVFECTSYIASGLQNCHDIVIPKIAHVRDI